MQYLTFPLRIEKTFLAKCDGREAALQMIRAMARTPGGSWKDCPSFGVRDLFEQARRKRELVDAAVRRMNAALEDLGVDAFRVAAIRAESKPEDEEQAYVVELTDKERPGEAISLAL